MTARTACRLNRAAYPASIRGGDDAAVLERLRVPPPGPLPPAGAPLSLRATAPAAADPAEGVLDARSSPRSADLHEWLFAGALAHPSGAIAGWRERSTGRLSDEYPEISGYYLSAAVFADATDSPAVGRAASWLSERIEAGACASRRVDGSAIYNFDQGIIAAGLIKYGVRTGNARAVAAGIRAASRLRDQLAHEGRLEPLDPAGGHPVGRPATWSTVGRLHLTKTVQCLLLAAELGVSGMREAARTLIDDASGAFSLESDGLRDPTGRVNLHATCYALEGFWIWDAQQRSNGHHAILEAAFDQLMSHRLPTGGFPRLARGEPREQSDVHAQVVRLAALLGRAPAMRTSVARLREIASAAERGWSVPYQPASAEIHENAWVTMFAAQALALVDGRPGLEWWELI
ncbi:MAG TPA: hypothetical protein VJP45_14265 [Candidatus Limnocylindria bacterium]|nr:hypothetical protein [Candidatus Limnocylindria bacterium]